VRATILMLDSNKILAEMGIKIVTEMNWSRQYLPIDPKDLSIDQKQICHD